MDFTITFWGVRGSRPVPGPDTLIYGGNTSCVQVQIGETLIILDAGTGIVNLGQQLLKDNSSIMGHIFVTHVHWDHIQGFPFFAPAFKSINFFTVYGEGKNELNFADIIKEQMKEPFFPIKIEDMAANIIFRNISPKTDIKLENNIVIKTIRTSHPNGCLAYRIEQGDKSCCYITDYEHSLDPDNALIEFTHGSDVVIYDSNYTQEEYDGLMGKGKKGWGHSTWQEGIKLVEAAKAKKLVLFHHDSNRRDNEVKEIERQAQAIYPNCLAAREGMSLRL